VREITKKYYNGGFITKEFKNEIMKQLYCIVFTIIAISLPFLFSFFVGNYTATAIGMILIGTAANIVMLDMKAKSRSMVYMWIAIIIIIAVLLGVQSILPRIALT